MAFNAIKSCPNAAKFPHAARWWNHIAGFTAAARAAFPGKPTLDVTGEEEEEADEDDAFDDLFGDDDDEDEDEEDEVRARVAGPRTAPPPLTRLDLGPCRTKPPRPRSRTRRTSA